MEEWGFVGGFGGGLAGVWTIVAGAGGVWRRRRFAIQKSAKARHSIIAMKPSAPMTIPAMTPAERPEGFGAGVGVAGREVTGLRGPSLEVRRLVPVTGVEAVPVDAADIIPVT